MYNWDYFSTAEGLTRFLNRKNIPKEDIVFITQDPKTQYFTLIYIEKEN